MLRPRLVGAGSHRRLAPAALALLVVASPACSGLNQVTAGIHVYEVPSAAMAKTINQGDRIEVRSGVRLTHGTVILFTGPDSWLAAPAGDGPRAKFVKRVIGLPGDHVVCCDAHGRITVNGQPLNEPYLYPGAAPSETPFDVTVGPGRLWVMGDNRAMSADSRAHANDHDGTIPVSNVVGVVVRVLRH